MRIKFIAKNIASAFFLVLKISFQLQIKLAVYLSSIKIYVFLTVIKIKNFKN